MSPVDDKSHDRPDPEDRVKIAISTAASPDFSEPLVAFAFDANGTLVDRAAVVDGSLTLDMTQDDAARVQLFVVPASEELEQVEPTPAVLKRLKAFEPILRAGHREKIVNLIEIPGLVLQHWPFCRCTVRGRVVRSSDGMPICNARVHICEVDEFRLVLERLPDLQIRKLRDDLVDIIRYPKPVPDPDPGPLRRSLLRLESHAAAPASIELAQDVLPTELASKLQSRSTRVVRDALVDNARYIYPYICHWQHWWFLLQFDEVAVRITDANGRFSASIPYWCPGDHPDIYFWVEYDFGNGYETVYAPSAGCWTYWEYACGSEKTIRVSDPRVPACYPEPNLPGRQIQIVSIGRTVGIGEIHTSGPTEGMVTEGTDDYGFGGSLEPRVWASNDALISSGITHYLWSRKGPLDADWVPLGRDVVRHFMTTTNLSGVESMKELSGPNAGRFRIRPKDAPNGATYEVADEREDLAWAHFDTAGPWTPGDPIAPCGIADPAAGKYQLKFELFDAAGQRVVWETAAGGPIILKNSTNEAPFGTNPVSFTVADDYHRIKNGAGNTVAFRMVLHVDNSKSEAEVLAIADSPGLDVEEECGVITHGGPSTPVTIRFRAGRPGGLARFSFSTVRGLSTTILPATASGDVDDAGAGTFSRSGCEYTSSGLTVSDFLYPPGAPDCSQGAFTQGVSVVALTTDGYTQGWLDAHDNAAFMLVSPCPECDDD